MSSPNQRSRPQRPAAGNSRRRDRVILSLVGVLSLVAAALAWSRQQRLTEDALPRRAATVIANSALVAAPKSIIPQAISPADLAQATTRADGALVLHQQQADLPLTIRPALQQDIQALLDKTKVPYGAIVLVDPQTGAILAMAEHREAGDIVGKIGDLMRPDTAAASVFKVVSAAALLNAGQTPETQACFHGGKHGIDASHVRASAADHQCQTLTEALAHSTNAAFARLALDHLQPGELANMATRLGFGASLGGDLRSVASQFAEGQTPLDRARAAPGFAGSSLSPLHAAMLAAAVANDGKVMRPMVFASDAEGHPRAPQVLGQAITPDQAKQLRMMMEQTVVAGTGRHAFGTKPRALRGISVGGKTGSLSGQDPNVYRHYSWFVGFAPVDHPKVAIAALAINGLQWRVKGAQLARDGLSAYFAPNKQPGLDAADAGQ